MGSPWVALVVKVPTMGSSSSGHPPTMDEAKICSPRGRFHAQPTGSMYTRSSVVSLSNTVIELPIMETGFSLKSDPPSNNTRQKY